MGDRSIGVICAMVGVHNLRTARLRKPLGDLGDILDRIVWHPPGFPRTLDHRCRPRTASPASPAESVG
jgi:hypothetical protein